MRPEDLAKALGLVINGEPRTLDLADGVKLTFRPPEGSDWSAAGTAVAKAMGSVKTTADARRLYGFGLRDVAALCDPQMWEGTADWCVAVELAARIVTLIERPVGEEVLTIAPDREAFAFLFKLGDNYERFQVAAKEAGQALISAKKE